MQQCIICDNKLSGKQTKYCSDACKSKSTNAKHQNYASQQARGWKRKRDLISMKGGKCEECGYSSNMSALCFHHLKDKEFGITIRELSNNKWERILKEADKCILLCSNCHMEIHNPDHML